MSYQADAIDDENFAGFHHHEVHHLADLPGLHDQKNRLVDCRSHRVGRNLSRLDLLYPACGVHRPYYLTFAVFLDSHQCSSAASNYSNSVDPCGAAAAIRFRFLNRCLRNIRRACPMLDETCQNRHRLHWVFVA